MTWELERPLQGKLRVTLLVKAKQTVEPSLGFVISAVAPTGGKRRLAVETLQSRMSGAVGRGYEADVSLPTGSKIELEATFGTADVWPAIHAGISVPLVETESATAKPSHVLIISIDALPSDHLGIYQALSGHPQAQSFSPQLDRFSEDAVVFLNARTTQSST